MSCYFQIKSGVSNIPLLLNYDDCITVIEFNLYECHCALDREVVSAASVHVSFYHGQSCVNYLNTANLIDSEDNTHKEKCTLGVQTLHFLVNINGDIRKIAR